MKSERNRRYDNNECTHKQWDCPQTQQGKAGKGVQGQSRGQTPYSSSQQMVPLSTPGARPPRWPLRLPPLELVCTRPPQNRWFWRQNLLRLKHLRRRTTTTCAFVCRRTRWRQWITGSPTPCRTTCPKLGHRIRHQFFTPFRCSRRHPRHSSGVEILTPFHTLMSRSRSLADAVERAWNPWRTDRNWSA